MALAKVALNLLKTSVRTTNVFPKHFGFERLHKCHLSTTTLCRGRMLYSENHEYVDVTDSKAKLGITDHAQKELGDVVYVDLPELGDLNAGDVACSVESVKAVAEVYMPISGKVIDVNKQLEDTPDLINKSPYTDGWLVEIEITKPEELDMLMDEKAYASYLNDVD